MIATNAPTVVHRDTDSVEQIAELFPSLRHIANDDLRRRVAACWREAMATGNESKGWSAEQLRRLPFTLKAGENGMLFVEHLNSCAAQCRAIARVLQETFGARVPVNLDVLIAGALLADIGKLYELRVDDRGQASQSDSGRLVRHPFSGVAVAARHGIPDEVLHIIAAHSFEGDKIERSIECIIFHHADFVDFDIAGFLGRRATERRS
ncbi:MAG: HDIG domain-containing protein [Phycisphaerales bacterium]|nr:HDIG domain-containing protein [Phycisphaerales bacterium]